MDAFHRRLAVGALRERRDREAFFRFRRRQLLDDGARDDFIHPDHSRDLLAAHGGDAELVLVDRDHQAPRPASCIARACLFCYDRLFDQVDARRQAYARRLDQLAADGLLEDEAESSGMTRDRQRNVIRTARLVRGQRAGGLMCDGVFYV